MKGHFVCCIFGRVFWDLIKFYPTVCTKFCAIIAHFSRWILICNRVHVCAYRSSHVRPTSVEYRNKIAPPPHLQPSHSLWQEHSQFWTTEAMASQQSYGLGIVIFCVILLVTFIRPNCENVLKNWNCILRFLLHTDIVEDINHINHRRSATETTSM